MTPETMSTTRAASEGSGERRPQATRGRLIAVRALVRRLVVFGAIGSVCFVIDVGLFNVLNASLLQGKPLTAKIVAALIATAVAWVSNRWLTFRSSRSRTRSETVREAILFALVNIVGIAIATLCLFVSHYVLGFRSVLADNISGNGVGLVLGTVFRYVAYDLAVFRRRSPRAAGVRGTASVH